MLHSYRDHSQPASFFLSRGVSLQLHRRLTSFRAKMVRLKNRYLLVNILYPELNHQPKDPKIPHVVIFNQPTTSSLTASALVKGLRAEVAELFGDYGSGAVNERLVGKILCTYQDELGTLSYLQSNIYRMPHQPSSFESHATIIELHGPRCL